MKPSELLLFPCAVFLQMGACDRQRPSPFDTHAPSTVELAASNAQLTSSRVAAPTAIDHSLASLSAARCDRDAHCERLGNGEKYADRQACMNEVGGQLDYDMGTSCSSGALNQAKLSACLAQLRIEPCANPKDAVKEFSACSASALCGS